MFNAKILISVATLAGTSIAQIPTSTSPACLSSLSEIGKNAPTPAPPLLSYLSSVIGTGPITAPGRTTALPGNTLEDPDGYQAFYCSIGAELPESLLPYFQSHAADLLSYGSAHLSQYDAYITNCITTGEAAATLTSALHKMLTGGPGACETTSTAAPGNGTYPTTPAPTGTNSTATSTASTTLVPTAAAARPTGAFVGAAAVGGLLGAVAML